MIYLLFLAILMLFKPYMRILMYPFKIIRYSIPDAIKYIYQKKYNECPYGFLDSYIGYFGSGKTLSAVMKVTSWYRRYNGKKVYCRRRKRFVRQQVLILSNIEITSVPYKLFTTMKQIIDYTNEKEKIEDELDVMLVLIVLGDEFSTQMNSRNFKSNLDALTLNTILTCRHYRIGILYQTQRFQHVDALLRQVTGYVIECKKLWRGVVWYYYNAWEMENVNTPLTLKPFRRKFVFVDDKHYNAYNTFAVVDNLKLSLENGDMLTTREILELQNFNPNDDLIVNPSRKYKRLHKKTK